MKSPDDDLLGAIGAVAREEDASATPSAPPPPVDGRLRQRLFEVAQAGVRRAERVASASTSDATRNAADVASSESKLETPSIPSSITPSGAPDETRALPLRPPAHASRRAAVPRAVFVGAALALAAGLAFYFTARPGTPPDAPMLAALPPYELDVTGGVATDRSDPAAPLPLVDGAPVTLTLRPTTRFEGEVEARAFVVRGDATEPLALASTVVAGGALRLTGTFASALPPGPAEIVVSIGPPGVLHDPRAGAHLVRRTILVGARR